MSKITSASSLAEIENAITVSEADEAVVNDAIACLEAREKRASKDRGCFKHRRAVLALAVLRESPEDFNAKAIFAAAKKPAKPKAAAKTPKASKPKPKRKPKALPTEALETAEQSTEDLLASVTERLNSLPQGERDEAIFAFVSSLS